MPYIGVANEINQIIIIGIHRYRIVRKKRTVVILVILLLLLLYGNKYEYEFHCKLQLAISWRPFLTCMYTWAGVFNNPQQAIYRPLPRIHSMHIVRHRHHPVKHGHHPAHWENMWLIATRCIRLNGTAARQIENPVSTCPVASSRSGASEPMDPLQSKGRQPHAGVRA